MLMMLIGGCVYLLRRVYNTAGIKSNSQFFKIEDDNHRLGHD